MKVLKRGILLFWRYTSPDYCLCSQWRQGLYDKLPESLQQYDRILQAAMKRAVLKSGTSKHAALDTLAEK